MKIVATVQARMSSSRLPGKVLEKLNGVPMLVGQVERIGLSMLVDEIVVATSTNVADDVIADTCEENKISIFRGSEHDVLARVTNAANFYGADIHVECYGDSPLIDPGVIDQMIGLYLKNQNEFSFVTNAAKTTYPPGMEVSVYGVKLLSEANNRLPVSDAMREHVGVNISSYRDVRVLNYEAPPHFFHPDIFLEVDEQQDLELMRMVFEHFAECKDPHFGLGEILRLFADQPGLKKVNASVDRKWRAFRND